MSIWLLHHMLPCHAEEVTLKPIAGVMLMVYEGEIRGARTGAVVTKPTNAWKTGVHSRDEMRCSGWSYIGQRSIGVMVK
jgi:hypothetical protein